jgi:hypothetical protein
MSSNAQKRPSRRMWRTWREWRRWRKQKAALESPNGGADVARDQDRIVVNDLEDDEDGNGGGETQGESIGGKRAMGMQLPSLGGGSDNTASVSVPKVMPRRNRPTRPSRNGMVPNNKNAARGNGKVVSVMDAAFQPDNDQPRDKGSKVVSVMSAAATERSEHKNALDKDHNAVDKDTSPTPPNNSWVNPLKSCGPEHKCQIFQIEGVRTRSMYFDKCVEQCDLLQISHYFGWQCGGCRTDDRVDTAPTTTTDSANNATTTVHHDNATTTTHTKINPP